MNTTLVATTSATFNWTAVAGATSYNVRYKTTAGATWTNTTSATTSKAVTGLTAATAYEWQVQTVCAAGTSAFTSSTTFTTTGGGGACVDNYEPNNTSGTAATLSAGTTYLELIASSTDVDWFKFTTTGSNTKIKISLSSLPADYDVRLYNQSVAQKVFLKMVAQQVRQSFGILHRPEPVMLKYMVGLVHSALVTVMIF